MLGPWQEKCLFVMNIYVMLLIMGLKGLAKQMMRAFGHTTFYSVYDSGMRSLIETWSNYFGLHELEQALALQIYLAFGEASGVERRSVLAAISDAEHHIEMDNSIYIQRQASLYPGLVLPIMLLAGSLHSKMLSSVVTIHEAS